MSSNTNEPASSNDPSLYGSREANPNMKGMDTSFSNMHISMEDNNRDLHKADVYQSMNVIPNQIAFPPPTQPERNVDPKYIPRQRKVIIHSDNKASGTNGNYKVKLNEPIKNVISVGLINCTLYDAGDNYAPGGGATFNKAGDSISLHMESGGRRFDKNIGCQDGNSDRVTGSFAILYFRGPITNATGNQVLYHNTFNDNHDIMYFDPPISAMSDILINLYDNYGNDTGADIENTFELLIETLEKVRVYV
jgi:hypothetical protein